MSIIARLRNSGVGEKKVLLTYNNIINNMNYVCKVLLNLSCVLNVLLMQITAQLSNTCPCCGKPKYLARLNKLNSSTETARQSLRMEHEGLSSPKEPGRQKCKLK